MNFLIALWLLAGACTTPAEQGVVARVKGVPIRLGELEAELKKQTTPWDSGLPTNPEAWISLRRKTLEGMIQERILLATAEQRGIQITEAEWSSERTRLQSGYSESDFQKVLAERKISEAEWEREQKKKMVINRLLDSVLATYKPSEKEIQAIYRDRRGSFREPERSHCRQIVTSSREKAKMIHSLLKKGANFAALALEHSESPDRQEGGDLGWVSRGELPPMMDEACFRFRPGETSGVVSSAYGFHIFRVLEQRPERQLSLDESRPLIEKDWLEAHRETILSNWLAQAAKEYPVEINELALSTPPRT